jgi:hypothetical protein
MADGQGSIASGIWRLAVEDLSASPGVDVLGRLRGNAGTLAVGWLAVTVAGILRSGCEEPQARSGFDSPDLAVAPRPGPSGEGASWVDRLLTRRQAATVAAACYPPARPRSRDRGLREPKVLWLVSPGWRALPRAAARSPIAD